MSPKLVAGIDPGVNTGVALWDIERQKLTECRTCTIVEAMWQLENLLRAQLLRSVCIEDARLRKWFGTSGREALMGAGSIKRDCKIWEEWVKLHKIEARFLSPQQKGQKLDADTFERITKWQGRTSEHARDAAVLAMLEGKR